MPISKNGKTYFTPEQYEKAKATSALEYARQAGYTLVSNGAGTYHLKEHDSMVFTPNGRWYWNSQNLKGGVIDFLIHYEDRSLVDAVLHLAGDEPEQHRGTAAVQPLKPTPKQEEQTQRQFELPLRSSSYKQLFGYLCGGRKLDVEVVRDLIADGRLYQGYREYADKQTGEVRQAQNAVFVGLDTEGTAKSGFQRGLSSEIKYHRDVAGSEKQYAFAVPHNPDVKTVIAFESAIDAISHATLSKAAGYNYKAVARLALGGVTSAPLLHYLENLPTAKKIILALDNDDAGKNAVKAIQKDLTDAGYTEKNGFSIKVIWPEQGKDWNDFLQQTITTQLAKEMESADIDAMERAALEGERDAALRDIGEEQFDPPTPFDIVGDMEMEC